MAGIPVSVVPVSVVVATHQRVALLERLVRALEEQDPDGGLEVVIVDDGSTDGTWEELGRLAAATSLTLRPLRREVAGGPAAARNLGWRTAGGGVIAFTDDDCVPRPGWLSRLCEPILAGRADLTQGMTRPERSAWDGSGPFARTMWVLEEDGFYATCNMAYRRSALEEAGGFDERFRNPFGEDTDLAWRVIEAGGRPDFVPDALVHHEVWPSSFRTHLRDQRRREGIVLAARLHPQIRRRFFRPHWYQGSHPRALLAAAGLAAGAGAALAGGRRSGAGLAGGLALAAASAGPYVHYRTAVRRLPCRRRNMGPVIALALVADLAEVGVLLAASARYRTLLL